MVFNVRVIPKSSRNLVAKDADGFKVHLTKPACDNLANMQLIDLLAEHLGVKKYQIKIIKGEKSRRKHVEVTC
jgi:uncharacterized protein (TIGR00251 family)